MTSEYDKDDRVKSLTQEGTNVTPKHVTFGYNQGQIKSISRFAGANNSTPLVIQASFDYDHAGRLKDLTYSGPVPNAGGSAPILDRFHLDYDGDSRIRQIVTTPTGAGLAAFTNTFGYDNASQITGTTSSLAGHNEDYKYGTTSPSAGNRSTSSSGSDQRRYTTGLDNRLMSDGKFNYRYDDEGNLVRKTDITSGRSTFYTWDARNRLVHVENRSTAAVNESGERTGTLLMSADYAYDVFNLRIAKTVDPDGAGPQPASRESYVYDGGQIIQEFLDPNTSDDSQSPDPTPAQLVRRNLYGPAVDQILAVEQFDLSTLNSPPSTVLWPLTDWQGSVRDLVQLSTLNGSTPQPVVAKHLDYDSFGNTIRVTDGSGQPSTLDTQPSTRFLYTGRELDAETGLQYNRARYYNAQTGRWLSQDPIGFRAGDANLYRYVGNNATNTSDPSGLVANDDSSLEWPIVRSAPEQFDVLVKLGMPRKTAERLLPPLPHDAPDEFVDLRQMEFERLCHQQRSIQPDPITGWRGASSAELQKLDDARNPGLLGWLGQKTGFFVDTPAQVVAEIQGKKRQWEIDREMSRTLYGESSNDNWALQYMQANKQAAQPWMEEVKDKYCRGGNTILLLTGIGEAALGVLAAERLAAEGAMAEGTALRAAAAADVESIEVRLARHVGKAVNRFEAEGFTKRQALRVAENPELEAAFRGERIDTFFKESVVRDAFLREQGIRVTPRFEFGPDVVDPASNVWYDVTRRGQWQNHLRKYQERFGQGFPLLY